MLFLHVKGYIFWKFDQSFTHWDEIQILQFLWDKEKVTEMHPFFFYELQLIAVSLLIRYCYMSWSTRFILLKLRVVFYIFDSAFITVYIFVQQKALILWLYNVLISFKLKIIEKSHTILLLDRSFLSCNNNLFFSLSLQFILNCVVRGLSIDKIFSCQSFHLQNSRIFFCNKIPVIASYSNTENVNLAAT